jgi:hypothetical protein
MNARQEYIPEDIAWKLHRRIQELLKLDGPERKSVNVCRPRTNQQSTAVNRIPQ